MDSTFEYAREWLAYAPTFLQTICGLSSVVDARARVYRQEVLEAPDRDESERNTPDDVPITERPFCIIVFGDDTRRRVGTGSWSGEGSLLFVFEVPVPEAYLVDWEENAAAIRQKFAARKQWGEDLLQKLRLELMQTSGQAGSSGIPFLNATSVDRFLSPADPELEEKQDFIGFALEVSYK